MPKTAKDKIQESSVNTLNGVCKTRNLVKKNLWGPNSENEVMYLLQYTFINSKKRVCQNTAHQSNLRK